MRLIRCKDPNHLVFEERFGDDIPPYAILSHTWGKEKYEPTYQDLLRGTVESKRGYQKLKLCAKEALERRLSYIWVDTCCI
jgi:hypothetical protein